MAKQKFNYSKSLKEIEEIVMQIESALCCQRSGCPKRLLHEMIIAAVDK